MTKELDLPVLHVDSVTDLETWLASHCHTHEGVWIKIAKKGAGGGSPTYMEIVECGLCFGWIDGQTKTWDTQYYIQRFTPRRPKSMWSKINTQKVKDLQKAGRMRERGMVEVRAAKRDGRWKRAYAGQSTFRQHRDFLAALKQDPQAEEFYGTLDKVNQYAIYFRLQTATKPDIRAKRFDKLLAMMKSEESIHSQ